VILSELKALMKKYKFEIKATDRWTGFAECGEDIKDIEFNDFIDCHQIDKKLEAENVN